MLLSLEMQNWGELGYLLVCGQPRLCLFLCVLPYLVYTLLLFCSTHECLLSWASHMLTMLLTMQKEVWWPNSCGLVGKRKNYAAR